MLFWLDRILGVILAGLTGAAIGNWWEVWRFSKHMAGERLMRPSEWVVFAAFVLVAMGLFAFSGRLLRGRRINWWTLLPAVFMGYWAERYARFEDGRRFYSLFLFSGGAALSLCLVLLQSGLTTRAAVLLRPWRKSRLDRMLWPLSVAALGILASCICWWVMYYAHRLLRDFLMNSYDYANLYQTMWTLAHEGVQRTTLLHYTDIYKYGYHAWGEHFTPVSFFILPFYEIFLWLEWHEIESVSYITIFFMNVAWLPLLFALRHHLRSRALAVGLTLAWMLHPLHIVVQTHGFHYESFFPFFFFTAYWFYVRRRLAGFVVFLLLSFTGKESMPIMAVCWGATIMVFHRGWRRWGALTAAIGAAYYVISMHIVVDVIRHGDPYGFISYRYGWLFEHRGVEIESAGDLVKNSIRYPMDVLYALTLEERWRGWMMLAGPFAYLMFLRPWTALMVIPPTMMHMLTSFQPQFQFVLYHPIEILPIYLVAVATALERPVRWVPSGGTWRRLQACAAIALVLSAVGAHVGRSMLPGGGAYPVLPPVLKRSKPWAPKLYEVLTSIPPERVPAGEGFAMVKLSGRYRAHYYLDRYNRDPEGDVPPDTTDIVVIPPRLIYPNSENEFGPDKLLEYLRRDMASGEWRLHMPYDPGFGVIWLERTPEGEERVPVENPEEILKDFFRDAEKGLWKPPEE